MPESVDPEALAGVGDHGTVPVPVEAPRGPFLQRVQRLRDWLREQFGGARNVPARSRGRGDF